MKRNRLFSILLVLLLHVALVHAQIENINIPAGTPEDQSLQAITKEPDPQKKLTMYADFLQQFSSNPAAVAYANWQVAQYYQGAGDLPRRSNRATRLWPVRPIISISSFPKPALPSS